MANVRPIYVAGNGNPIETDDGDQILAGGLSNPVDVTIVDNTGTYTIGSLRTRITTLEAESVRTTRFVSIASGTAGTVTLPTGATVVLDDFGGGIDAVVCTIESGRPTFVSARTAAGAVVTTSFDAGGAYSFSGTPSAYPVALIYRVRQPLIDYNGADSSIIGEFDTEDIVGPGATTDNGLVTWNGANGGRLLSPAGGSFVSGQLRIDANTNQIALGTTNTTTFTMAALTGSRTFTLPDANSNSVVPSTAPANQFATGISAAGVISYAQPSFSNLSGTVSLTTQVSGILPVANGGTNSSATLSNSRIMVSVGGAIVEAAALTNGQLLIGSTGGAPVAAAIAGTANQVIVTNGAGSITLSTPQNIHTAATPTFASMSLSAASNQLVLSTGVNQLTFNGGTSAAARTYSVPDVGTTASFVMTAGTQTVAGAKTFSSAVAISVGTNQLVLSTGVNQLTLNGGTSAAARTYTVPDVGTTSSFVMTAGVQTIGGAKTLSSALTITPNTSQIVIGTTNTTTFTMAALTGSRVFTLPDANSNPVQPSAAPANQFATGISAAGVISYAQPSFANLTGQVSLTTQVSGILPVANGGTNSSATLNNNRIMVSSGGAIVEAAALTNGQLLIGSTGVAPVAAALTGTADQVIVTNGAGSITLSLPQNVNTAATPTFASQTLTAASNQLTLSSGINQLILNSGTSAAARTYTVPDVGTTASFVMTAGTQTIAGAKTFSSALTITPNTNQIVIGTTNTTTVTMAALTGSRVFTLPDANSNSVIPSTAPANQFATAISAAGVISYAQPSFSNLTGTVSLTTQVSGILPVANGGTNSSATLNNNRIMVSSGGAIVEAAALTNGQLLIGSTGAAPVAAAIAGTANQVVVTNGAGSITLSLPQNINTAATPTFASMTLTAASNQLTVGSGVNALTINGGTSAAARTYTVPDVGTTAGFVMTAGAQTIAGAKTLSSALTITPNTNQLVLGTTNTSTITMAALTGSRVFTLPDANSNSVVPSTAGANQFASGISAGGVIAYTALDADLVAIAALGGTGILVRTGTDTWATRTLVAGTGITLTNPAGVAGDLTIAITNTTVTPTSYGSATAVSQVTFNAQGQATAAASVSIAIPASQVTDFNEAAQDAVGGILTDTASVDLTYNDAGNTISATVLPAGVDHNALANLATGDVHTQYALLAGRATGQLLRGGTAASENLTLSSTANATKGRIILGASTTGIDEVNNRLGVGITSPSFKIHAEGTTDAAVLVRSSLNTSTGFFEARNDTNTALQAGVYGSTNVTSVFGDATAGKSYLLSSATGPMAIGTTAGTGILFGTNSVEIARFTSTGQLAVGATAPNAAAKVQIDSTTQGFLLPRMTTAQMDAIASPPAGLRIYNTTLNTECTYSGTRWLFDLTLTVLATQSSTSATYADITELVTPSLPVGNYVFQYIGVGQSTATATGSGYRMGTAAVGGATVTQVLANWSINQAVNGTDKNFDYSQLDATTNVTSASTLTANANFPVGGRGVFTVSVAGAMAVQLRTENGGTGVSVRAGSAVIIRRINS